MVLMIALILQVNALFPWLRYKPSVLTDGFKLFLLAYLEDGRPIMPPCLVIVVVPESL
jgi:hypothetical protein